MIEKKPEQTKVPSAAHELNETELLQDLEIEDAQEADAVKGGQGGKVTFSPWIITR
ncbi:MAG TPA: hypothetical protein VIH85_21630 [Solirubrobacteraceae bacterium]